MRILDRYIAWAFLKNLVFAAVGLTALLFFQSILGEILGSEFTANQVVTHKLMDLPQIFVQMLPPSVLLATVLTLSGFNRTAELTAMYSIGIGVERVVAVLLTLVFAVSCLSLVIQDRIAPPLHKQQTIYYWRVMKKKADFYLDLKQNKVWYRSKNYIYNLRSFDTVTKTILGMVVYSFDEAFKLRQVIEAERADFTSNGWKLRDGTVTVFEPNDPFPLSSQFKEKELVIQETPDDFREIEKEDAGLRLLELRDYIRKVKGSGTDTKTFEVNYHSRWSLSFIPLVMCLIGVPFSVRNRREGGLARDLGICLGVTFFYWLFYSVGLSLGKNGALPPWLAAWAPTLVFTLFAGYLISRREKA